MKTFLLILATSILLLAQQILGPIYSQGSQPPCAVSGYSRYRAIVIDHTQVGASDLTNFPLLVNVTNPDFATAGSGGYVQNTVSQSGGGVAVTVPADLIFAADPAGLSVLSFEWESYNSTTGAITVWVKIPNVSHTFNTTFYVLYGKASTATFQGNVPNTWNSNFQAVWHLNDAVSPAVDSTSNTHSASGTGTFGSAGQIGNAVSFASASTQQLTGSDAGLPAGVTPRTISAWYKPSSASGGILSYGTATQYEANGLLYNSGSHPDYHGWLSDFITTFTPSLSAWHFMAATFDGATASVYSDGSAAQTMTESSWNTVLGSFSIGSNFGASSGQWFNGSLDEIRVSNVVRPADWITAEYNNQKSGSTMLTVGAGTTCGSNAPVLVTVTPNNGQLGQTLTSVAIVGQNTHFAAGTSVASFGSGITVNSLTVASATTATASITIAGGATTGASTVTMTTGTEVASLTSGFTVTGAGTNVTYTTSDYVYPSNIGFFNVKSSPYNATGNGTTDDSAAIQAAFTAAMNTGYNGNRGGTVYFPCGTYLVSQQFLWLQGSTWKAFERWIGQNRDCVTLKIQNSVSWGTNAGCKLKISNNTGATNWCHALIVTGNATGTSPATDGAGNEEYQNTVMNMTINLGTGNPDIVALDYNQSNIGAIQNVNIVCPSGTGQAGINLARLQGLGEGPGPGLLKNISVTGCNYGIYGSAPSDGSNSTPSNNSLQNFEYINLQNQNAVGFLAGYRAYAIREVSSTNSVPAFRTEGGTALTLVDANLAGGSGSFNAIDNSSITSSGGVTFFRNITSSGYNKALSAGPGGSSITEYAYPSQTGTSLGIVAPNTPEFQDTNLANWVDVGAQGAACLPNSGSDATSCIQAAINSMSGTQDVLYFRFGAYLVNGTLNFNNTHLRLIEGANSYFYASAPQTWQIGSTSALQFQWMTGDTHINVNYDGSGTLTMKHSLTFPNSFGNTSGTGDIYSEDVFPIQVSLSLRSTQHAYLRQWDVEIGGTHTTISGGTTWIFGYKTEGGGTLLALSSGSAEILGTWGNDHCSSGCTQPVITLTSMTHFTLGAYTLEPTTRPEIVLQTPSTVLVPNNTAWGGNQGVGLYAF